MSYVGRFIYAIIITILCFFERKIMNHYSHSKHNYMLAYHPNAIHYYRFNNDGQIFMKNKSAF